MSSQLLQRTFILFRHEISSLVPFLGAKSESRSAHPIEPGSNPDPDPKLCSLLSTNIHCRFANLIFFTVHVRM
jgi:hypothetical protein